MHGFDTAIVQSFSTAAQAVHRTPIQKVTKRLRRIGFDPRASYRVARGQPTVFDYAELDSMRVLAGLRDFHFPCVVPNWDNTPRSARRGLALQGATPTLFRHAPAGRTPMRRCA